MYLRLESRIYIFLLISGVFAYTLVVPTDYPNIQAGVDAAVDGDTVLVLDGEYTGEGNFDIGINEKSITLISEFGPDNCIINPIWLGRGILIQSFGNVIINGFKIKNGLSSSGSGIGILGNYHTISNCIFQNNIATQEGGGAMIINGDAEFINCIFINNEAPHGAGISLGNWADAWVYNSIIFDELTDGPEGVIFAYYCLHPPDSPDPIWNSYYYVITDPLFVDPDNGNFHLQVQSPRINAGDPDAPLDPDSTRMDIGPYYYPLELKGDANFDGEVSVLDIIKTLQVILETETPFNAQLWAMDMNEDEVIDVADVILIVETILN